MEDTDPTDENARRQVDAFMRHLQEKLDLDENHIQKVVEKQKRNGRLYVTWGAVLSICFILLAFLANDWVTRLEKNIERISTRQDDVRERLKEVETILREHTK